MTVRISESVDDVDWDRAKADLAADHFDNGRTADALRRSFARSQHVAFAIEHADDHADHDGGRGRTVAMARLLSDGVCNAYLLDVFTLSSHRRRRLATTLVATLLDHVPGQHVGLQTDDATAFYESLGFRPQPEFMSTVVGRWLDNDAN